MLWTVDNGATYTKLTAAKNETAGYDFDPTGVPANAVIKIAIKGDADMDGEVDVLDASKVAYSTLSQTNKLHVDLNALEQAIADVDGDGEIDALDASAIAYSTLASKNQPLSW